MYSVYFCKLVVTDVNMQQELTKQILLDGQQVDQDGSPNLAETGTENQFTEHERVNSNGFPLYHAFDTESLTSSISSASPPSGPTISTEPEQYFSTNNAQVKGPPGFTFNQNIASTGQRGSSNFSNAGTQWPKQQETQSHNVPSPIELLMNIVHLSTQIKQNVEMIVSCHEEMERVEQQIAKAIAGSSLNLNVLDYCNK